MNVVAITGRLVKDAEVNQISDSDSVVSTFSIAVQKDYPDKDGKYGTDFFKIVTFGKTAKFVERFGKKGVKFEITGSLRQNVWKAPDGKNRYEVLVAAKRVNFAESANSYGGEKAVQEDNDMMTFTDIGDDEVPFI